MKPNLRILAGVVIVALAATAAMAWSTNQAKNPARYCGNSETGPLAPCPGSGGTTYFVADPDEHHTFAFDVINAGDKETILTKATLVNPSHGISMTAYFTADPGFSVNHYPAFPPDGYDRGDFVPLSQAHVVPVTEADLRDSLVLEIVVTEEGILGFDAVRLDYKVDGHPYEAVYSIGALICSPRRDYPEGCP